MYEIIWTRFLNLTFGCTTYSITTVLTAFMAGLALGSLVFGRIVDRWNKPLLFYGLIEMAIGVFALLTIPVFAGITEGYLFLVKQMDLSGSSQLILKFGLSFLVMLLPTTLMGASLPVLSKYFIITRQDLSKRLGLLYAVNTFGAVLGTFLVGFTFLYTLGLRSSLIFAAVLNLGIGLLVIVKDRELRQLRQENPAKESPSQEKMEKEPESQHSMGRVVIRYAILAFMISGFISMVYEIAWTRLLTLIIGSSTYAFSMILICFLFGIALGSYVVSKFVPKKRIGLKLFVSIQLLIAFFGYLLIPLFSYLPDLMLVIFKIFPNSYNAITLYQFGITFSIVIIPTMLMGATLPVIGHIVSGEIKMIGRKIGDIYFFNTFGAIFGSFIGGFILIPHLGTLSTLKLSIFTNVLIAVFGLIVYRTTVRPSKYYSYTTFTFIPILIFMVFQSGWDKRIMDCGVSVYGQMYSGLNLRLKNNKQGSELLFLKEGLNATITVRRDKDSVYLRSNGKTDASTRGDMATQLFSGYLPLFAHPNPETALVIGFGSGVTSGVMAQFDFVKHLDIAEIEPSVIEASRFFSEVNHDVVQMPNVKIHYKDGRNFLLESDKLYDIISSEPSNPWISGVASLFTDDFYRIVNRHLKVDGIFCQWMQTYNMSYANIRLIMATLAQNFRHVQVWYATSNDLLVICSNNDIVYDDQRVNSLIHTNKITQKEFKKYLGLDSSSEFYGRFLFGDERVRRIARVNLEESFINTDDKPYLEFLAPRTLYDIQSATHIFKHLTSSIEIFPPNDSRNLTPRQYHENLCFRAQLMLDYNLVIEASAFAQKALDHGDSSRVQILLGRIRQAEKQIFKAKEHFENAMKLDPADDGYVYLSKLLLGQGYTERAIAVIDDVDPLTIKNKNYELTRAKLLCQANRFAEAVPWFEKAFQSGQIEGYSYYRSVGLAYYQAQNFSAARPVLEKASELNPLDPVTADSLANVYLSEKRYEKVVEIYLMIGEHFELKPKAYEMLVLSYNQMGQPDMAKRMIKELYRRHPNYIAQLNQQPT